MNVLFLKYNINTYIYIYITTHSYEYMYVHLMIIFERLSQFDFEIYEDDHQDRLTVDGDIISH
jgi:hypothetical protein